MARTQPTSKTVRALLGFAWSSIVVAAEIASHNASREAGLAHAAYSGNTVRGTSNSTATPHDHKGTLRSSSSSGSSPHTPMDIVSKMRLALEQQRVWDSKPAKTLRPVRPVLAGHPLLPQSEVTASTKTTSEVLPDTVATQAPVKVKVLAMDAQADVPQMAPPVAKEGVAPAHAPRGPAKKGVAPAGLARGPANESVAPAHAPPAGLSRGKGVAPTHAPQAGLTRGHAKEGVVQDLPALKDAAVAAVREAQRVRDQLTARMQSAQKANHGRTGVIHDVHAAKVSPDTARERFQKIPTQHAKDGAVSTKGAWGAAGKRGALVGKKGTTARATEVNTHKVGAYNRSQTSMPQQPKTGYLKHLQEAARRADRQLADVRRKKKEVEKTVARETAASKQLDMRELQAQDTRRVAVEEIQRIRRKLRDLARGSQAQGKLSAASHTYARVPSSTQPSSGSAADHTSGQSAGALFRSTPAAAAATQSQRGGDAEATHAATEQAAFRPGYCRPTGLYTRGQCCPKGYVEIKDVASCRRAYYALKPGGAAWGGEVFRNRRPSGCYRNLAVQKVRFNPADVNGNGLEVMGDDEVICQRTGDGQHSSTEATPITPTFLRRSMERLQSKDSSGTTKAKVSAALRRLRAKAVRFVHSASHRKSNLVKSFERMR